MKINKLIAAAMSIAVVGETMPFIGSFAPEMSITANADDFKNVFPELETLDCECAEIYNEEDGEWFMAGSRQQFSGVILSTKESDEAYIEFDISDIDTFSCLPTEMAGSILNNAMYRVNVYLDDELQDNWNFFKRHDVSGYSSITFELKNESDRLALCRIAADEYGYGIPDTPECSSNAEFLSSAYDSQNVEIYTGEDKNKTYKIRGREYSQGIILNGLGGGSENKENMASVSFNVEDIERLKFTVGRHASDTPPYNAMYTGGSNGSYFHIYLDGKPTSAYIKSCTGEMDYLDSDYFPANSEDFIYECDFDVSKAKVMTIEYAPDIIDSYAIMNISVDDMPLGLSYAKPVYSSTADIINGLFDDDTITKYAGDDGRTFTAGGKVYNQGIVLDPKYTYFKLNTENLNRISFDINFLDSLEEDKYRSGLIYIYAQNIEGGTEKEVILGDKHMIYSTVPSSTFEKTSLCTYTQTMRIYDGKADSIHCEFDVSDMFYIEFNASTLGNAVITNIEYNPKIGISQPEKNDTLIGDVNNDNTVNLKDVVLIRRYIAGGWGVALDETVADVNKDNAVNLKDVVLLRRYIAGGWDVTLG